MKAQARAPRDLAPSFARCGIITVQDLFSRIRNRHPVFLLGAGASVKSGIPASAELLWLVLRWLYADRHAQQPDDPRITRSDLHRLLLERPWYDEHAPVADFFPLALEELGHPRTRRRDFILDLISKAAAPSLGYERLAELLNRKIVDSVLTTNFDNLIERALGFQPAVTIEAGSVTSFSTSPTEPQVVFLHGRAEHYGERALPEEIEHLDSGLGEVLPPLLRDRPLVVIGYRGAERSVMQDLLLSNVGPLHAFRAGIFWCVRGEPAEAIAKTPPLVEALAHAIGPNLNFVGGLDFDGVLDELASLWTTEQRLPLTISSRSAHVVADPLTLDRRPTSLAVATECDWRAAELRLRGYCARMNLALPDGGREALEAVMREAGLAAMQDGELRLTIAGALLFTQTPRRVAPGAWIELALPDRPAQALADGDLWSQHERAMTALSERNRPLRIKSKRSDVLRIYPERSVHEVLANALIHRDYGIDEPIRISLEDEALTITSPGGLEDALLHRLLRRRSDRGERPYPSDLLQQQLDLGDRGAALTSYRNPVLADLFYGTDLVEKAGSGLPDALALAERVGGSLRAQINGDNSRFTVRLRPRPATVDAATATARPVVPTQTLRFNLLPVISMPTVVWSAPTQLRPRVLPSDELRALPRFTLYGGRLFTFSELSDPANPLRRLASGRPEPGTTAALQEDPVHNAQLVHLMHELLFARLQQVGMRTNWRERLAYYACTHSDARYVEYRSRARERQRRRVAHWPGPTRRYCEHKAARFRFEQFGDAWAVVVLPTYVFTRDGARERIIGPEAASLATAASTEDYNQKALFDVVFWASVLSGGQPTATLADGRGAEILIDCTLPEATVTPLVSTESVDEPPTAERPESEEHEREGQVADGT